MTRDTLRRYGYPALVALVAVAVYANSLWNGFALDDTHIIEGNSRVHQLTDLGRIWLTPYWPSFGQELGLYRPLAIFGYALQWAVSGGAPWFFHAVNLALHALVCVLGFLLLRRLTGDVPALVGSLVFAVHPVHTEVVANVVGQAELIAAAALIGACLIHASRPEGAGVGWGRRIAILALFAIGVLAKESAIVLPALLVAVDLAQRRVRLDPAGALEYARGLAMPIFLLVAAAGAYLVLRVDVVGSIGGVDAAPQLPFLRHQQEHRILTALRAWPEFVRLLFFPADLSSDYSPAVILPVESITPMAWLGAGLLALALVLALLTPWSPAVGLPAAWFFITVFPTSNLLMPIGVVLAERILYTPSFAVALLVAFGAQALARAHAPARTRRAAVAAMAVVLVLMAVRTWSRNPDWKDTRAVWAALIRDHPESYRAQWILGSLHFQAGNPEAGEGYLRNANHLWPYDSQLLSELAFEHLGRGQFEEALPLLERSRDLVPFLSRTHILLANTYLGVGRPADALRALRQAEVHGADGSLTWPARAQAYERLGQLDLAISAWRVTLRQSFGGLWNYRAMLARDLAQQGHRDSALAALDSVAAVLDVQDDSARSIVQDLRNAISAGCYDLPARRPPADPASAEVAVREGCVDPLAEWQVLVPIVTFEGRPSSGPAPDAAKSSPAGSPDL